MTQGNASGIIGSEENGAAFRAWYLSDSITDSGSVMATQYEIGNSDGINQANGARRFNAATAPTMANVKADIYEAIREMLANNDGQSHRKLLATRYHRHGSSTINRLMG